MFSHFCLKYYFVLVPYFLLINMHLWSALGFINIRGCRVEERWWEFGLKKRSLQASSEVLESLLPSITGWVQLAVGCPIMCFLVLLYFALSDHVARRVVVILYPVDSFCDSPVAFVGSEPYLLKDILFLKGGVWLWQVFLCWQIFLLVVWMTFLNMGGLSFSTLLTPTSGVCSLFLCHLSSVSSLFTSWSFSFLPQPWKLHQAGVTFVISSFVTVPVSILYLIQLVIVFLVVLVALRSSATSILLCVPVSSPPASFADSLDFLSACIASIKGKMASRVFSSGYNRSFWPIRGFLQSNTTPRHHSCTQGGSLAYFPRYCN